MSWQDVAVSAVAVAGDDVLWLNEETAIQAGDDTRDVPLRIGSVVPTVSRCVGAQGGIMGAFEHNRAFGARSSGKGSRGYLGRNAVTQTNARNAYFAHVCVYHVRSLRVLSDY